MPHRAGMPSGPVAFEVRDELAGALVGEEQPRALELDEGGDVRKRVRQPVRPLDVEDGVAGAPDDERGRREAAQRGFDGEQVARIQRGQPALELPRALVRPDDRLEEARHDLQWQALDGLVAGAEHDAPRPLGSRSRCGAV